MWLSLAEMNSLLRQGEAMPTSGGKDVVIALLYCYAS
jgi:hypothetical protein